MKANQSVRRDESANIGVLMAALIGALVFTVLGLALTKTVNSQANTASTDANATKNGTSGLIGTVPLLWVILIVAGIAVFIFVAFKSFG